MTYDDWKTTPPGDDEPDVEACGHRVGTCEGECRMDTDPAPALEEESGVDKPATPEQCLMDRLTRARGVRDACPVCRGLGTRLYGSGSTWRGGMGTASMEYDVCDSCWGSGDQFRHGEDLRKLRDEEAARVVRLASEYLFGDLSNLTVLRPGIEEFCAEVDKLNSPRSRKKHAYGFDTVCAVVAERLRKGL